MDAINDDYPQHIAEFVAANYGAAVLLVNYHCIQNHYGMGARHYLDETYFAILAQTCQSLEVSLPAELTPELNEAAREKSTF